MLILFFSLGTGVVIMRMYALYEQSRKVLALCITFATLATVIALVSLNLRGSIPHIPLLILLHAVGTTGWTHIKPSILSNTERLWCGIGSGKVSTLL